MRIDLPGLRSAWRQTVWGTVLGMGGVLGLVVYELTSGSTDHSGVQILSLVLVAMPLLLGIAYLIRRAIERLAD